MSNTENSLMKVLIVNTSERTGGAAIAANRLKEALNRNGVKAKMLVRDKQTQDITVSALKKTWRHRFQFLWERFVIWYNNFFNKTNLFQIDIANTGTDITQLPEFAEADVIHLHWINQGYLSLADINKILHSGKPVVWTMHDMWPFTGICHYSGTCTQYRSSCKNCPLLQKGGEKDLAARVFHKKQQIFQGARITFVACSKWLENLARESALLQGQRIISIPNTINANIFQKLPTVESRQKFKLPLDKKLLLFGSMKITDKRKGADYLVEACRILTQKHPDVLEKVAVVMVGQESQQMAPMFPFPVYALDYISEEKQIASLYAASDVFVTPSLEDNLPNTIVEAMSCGTPCIGFHTGGIPEMIDHKLNGYIATYKDAEDLAEGIYFLLEQADSKKFSEAALHKATSTYNENHVSMQYIHLYNQTNSGVKA